MGLPVSAVVLVGCGFGDQGSGAVTGVVTDSNGVPVAECNIIPEPTSSPRPALTEEGYLTDEQGEFRIVLPVATYSVLANCPPQEGDSHSARAEVADVVVSEGEELIVNFRV